MSALITRAAKIFAPATLGLLSGGMAYAAPQATRYTCAASEGLTVHRTGSAATVIFAGRTYELRRARSSIGEKYLSGTAALMIDGPSAVFVSDDHTDLGPCTNVVPLASR